jgi:hypothetical protein
VQCNGKLAKISVDLANCKYVSDFKRIIRKQHPEWIGKGYRLINMYIYLEEDGPEIQSIALFKSLGDAGLYISDDEPPSPIHLKVQQCNAEKTIFGSFLLITEVFYEYVPKVIASTFMNADETTAPLSSEEKKLE